MREPPPDFSAGQYERPNQPWMCGLSEDGQACPAGPTAHGACPARGECAPLRAGDRWQCNRSALRGGVCEPGPTPDGGCGRVLRCHPVRNLRAKRGRFVAACTLFAAGALTILLSANWRDAAIAPGPLARQHAQLMERGGAAANCAACHAAAEQSVGGWAAALLAGHAAGPTQSQLCMKCHDQTIDRDLALVAHNLPMAELQKLNGGDGDNSLANEELACATCHREHHGAEFKLTALDNAACQACHHERYRSFADDHPDLGVWPYERRTRIVFDHASHQAKHFAEKKQTFDCRQCHVEDETRKVQLTASYETTCAACHDEKIATSVARGVPMLALPTLDIDALESAGHVIGPWPEAATGDFDGRLPPMMKLLLAADEAAARAMATLGDDFEFQDVDPEDEEQLAACADLARAIKSLLADVSQRGPTAVGERLSATLGREVSPTQVDALVAGMSADTVRGAVTAWLPNVDAGNASWVESADRRVGRVPRDPPLLGMVGLAELDPPYAPAGAWHRDDATLTIRYRPAAHADPVLTSWLAALAETPELTQRSLPLAMFKELSQPTATGLCASCHSAEQTAAGQLAINWNAYDRSNGRRAFTKFSHGPHLLLPQLSDCTECHAIDLAATTAASHAEWNPHTFVSEFRPLSKRHCAQCHTATAAGDQCQSCHIYHVDVMDFAGR